MENNIASLELSKMLKEIGFNETCSFAYVQEYGVKESIMALYPGLSDCGYQDLTKEYGGEYEENEVYEHRVVLVHERHCDNVLLEGFNQIAAAPHIFDVKKWVENEYNVIIQTDYRYSTNDYACSIFESEMDEIRHLREWINNDSMERYSNEKDAIEATIINFLNEKNNAN